MWDIPERYCKLELYAGRATTKPTNVLSRLDKNARISFNTSETVSGAVNETVIEISGLTRQTMGYLATSYSQWQVNQIRNEVIIDAGFFGRHGIIFRGDIIEATPNLDTADFSIRLRAMSYYEKLIDKNFSYSVDGKKKVSEIIKELAGDNNFEFVNGLENNEEDVEVENYSYMDTNLQNHLRYLANMTHLDIYTSGNKIIAKKKDGHINNYNSFTIRSTDIIGSPSPTPQGCNIEIRMNPSVKTGQRVVLQSKRFDILNSDKYVIQTISHTGDTKGSKWQTNLVLIREDIYQKR